jgi:hypothetical protein
MKAYSGQTFPSKFILEDTTPVLDQGALGSCHDPLTEVLTDEGFKLFIDLNGYEKLASVNPETSEFIFERPTNIFAFKHKGKLYCAKHRSVDFKVTADHKMLVRKWDESKRTLNDRYELVEASKLGWYFGLMNRVKWRGENSSETYTLKGVPSKLKKNRSDERISMKYWLRFLGIYLAEGTMLKRGQRKGTISYKIQIAFGDDEEKRFIIDTLLNIGINCLPLRDRVVFSNKKIYENMSALGLEGVKAGGKFVPRFVFGQSADLIKEFLFGHFNGDGCEDVNRSHYTGSGQLANDLQTLIFLSGDESYVGVREPRNSVMSDGRVVIGRLKEHRVSVCERKTLSVDKKQNLHTEDYDGMVFCAEVPTYHTLVTRRNGKILISGNCTAHGILGLIAFELVQNNGLPYSLSSRLALYWLERFQEGTINEDSGAEIRDGIKATNMWGIADESLWPYDISKFTQKPPQEYFTKALTDRLKYYAAVDCSNINNVKLTLSHGHGIVFGTNLYGDFENYTKGVIQLPAANDQLLGGHCMFMVGFDDSIGAVYVKNSWSESWGDAGHVWFSYEYVQKFFTDLWCIHLKP